MSNTGIRATFVREVVVPRSEPDRAKLKFRIHYKPYRLCFLTLCNPELWEALYDVKINIVLRELVSVPCRKRDLDSMDGWNGS